MPVRNIMIQEHQRLNSMLDELEWSLSKNSTNIKELFDKFKANLEKHFYIEEKIIFDIAVNMKQEDVETNFDLMTEHGEIISELKKVENDLNMNNMPDITELKDKLIKHTNFEDLFFYPRLQEKLSEQQTAFIIDKSREILDNPKDNRKT